MVISSAIAVFERAMTMVSANAIKVFIYPPVLLQSLEHGALKNQVQHFWEKMLHGKTVQTLES